MCCIRSVGRMRTGCSLGMRKHFCFSGKKAALTPSRMRKASISNRYKVGMQESFKTVSVISSRENNQGMHMHSCGKIITEEGPVDDRCGFQKMVTGDGTCRTWKIMM